MQVAITGNLGGSFQPVPIPGASDWLKNHQELGQTLKSFEEKVHKAVPHGT